MAYKVVFAADAIHDLELIFDFLIESYIAFGDTKDDAFERAENRLSAIQNDARILAKAPQRGIRHDDVAPGLRHVTINRAIYYFDIDEAGDTIRILAIFFGGQDHVRRMLVRLLGGAD